MAESIERFPVSEKGYSLPINEVLTGRGFVTGKSGSGKSNTASVVAEELLDRGLGLLIIDTDGEYSALKERYELLQVGGDEACDREITAEDAPLIADLALEENVPIILDISGYLDEEVAEDVLYAVVRELFVAENQHQKPFLLFLEEAHEFIPERGGGDDVHKMLVRIAKRGRKRGLGIVAMSQRPAAVAKDYITQCDWLVWHRLTWENDTKVAGRILGGDAAESVQSLADGEALVMSDWDETISRVQFRRKKTNDRGSTPTLRDAYGPPSAREDHVTQSEGGDTATDGGEGTERTDERSMRAETNPADEAATAQDDGTWDRSDIDIEPRQPSLEGATRHSSGGQAAADRVPDEPESGSGRGGAGSRRTAVEGTRGRVAAGRTIVEPDPADEHADDGIVVDRGRQPTDRRRQPPTAAPRPLGEPEEYDPLWEIGQFFVYCCGRATRTHAAVYGRFCRGYTNFCLGLRRSAFGTYTRSGPGRAERRAGTVLALITVLVLYAALAGLLVAGFALR